MKSQAVLLSPQAQMNAKPELEIFADDVVCGHGATVASIDPEQVFYLQSARHSETARRKRCCSKPSAPRRSPASRTRRWPERLRALLAAWLAGRHAAGDDSKRHDGGERVNDMVRPVEPYDVAKIRGDFPILAERPYGKPLVYLDNAASAQKPKAVLDRLTYAYEHEYANVHRGLHYLANAATEAYEAARETVRRFLNAASTDEIVFTRSATEAINLVAASFGLKHIGAGDEIVLSVMEHHSNIVPWHFHRERKGAVLSWIEIGDDGSFSLDAFEKALSDADEDRRDHADVERPRHGAADQGDHPDRACARDQGAGRRLAGRRPSRRRRARPRRRLLRRHRPQALRADRNRRALRQARTARSPCRRSWAAAR